jgi:phage tail sheath protein FI
MSFGISAGVYTKEIDLSNIIPNVATTTAGLVGYSAKGDITQIRLITNTQQFINEYGEPTPGNYFHYTALAFLENGNRLYCLRVVNAAKYGGVTIKEKNSGESNAAIAAGVSTPVFADDTGSDNLFQVYGKDPGLWNNDIGIRIPAADIDDSAYTFNIEVYVKDEDGNYQLKETWTVSRKEQTDGYGRQQYLEDKINGYSEYIIVADSAQVDTALPLEQDSTLALAEGTDGSTVTASHIDTGWDFFANPDDVDIRLLLQGGGGEANADQLTVQTKLKTIAEARKDCVAILDMPYAQITSPASMVTWRTSTQIFNSSYCALYAPWVKWYDQYNDKILELPPSGFVGSIIAYTDNVSQPWYAAAGLNRGIIQSALGFTDVFTEGERDALYEDQINPLQTFRGDGNVVWGQKMEKTKPSALDRLNVRRLLIILEKAIAASLRFFVFEPNSELTRFRIVGMCEEYLDLLYARGAFQSIGEDKGYKVVCDTTNNTPATIDRNELHVDVYVKPIRAAEYIQLNVIVTTTGTTFSELIAKGVQF